MVRRQGCLPGFNTRSGFALALEIDDWSRFTGATIGSFVGLASAEYSSGSSRSPGPITKTGNRHVRRLLLEAAWHHRVRYRPGKTLRER
jgi:transposase